VEVAGNPMDDKYSYSQQCSELGGTLTDMPANSDAVETQGTETKSGCSGLARISFLFHCNQ